MYKTDRHSIVGFWGMTGSIVMFFVSLFITQGRNDSIPYPLIMIILVVFFLGYMFGGGSSGVLWCIGFIGIIGIVIGIGLAVRQLTQAGIVPENKWGLVLLVFFVLITLGLYLVKFISGKKNIKRSPLHATKSTKEEQKKNKKVKYKLEERDRLKDAIFLIYPRWWSFDIVYKVFIISDMVYFCRVGGQFYEIRENESKYNMNLDDETFAGDKYNFKISAKEIVTTVINTKRSIWTGEIPNNGTVTISLLNQRKKYIIHAVQSANLVHEFLKGIPGITVEVIDKRHTGNNQVLKRDRITLKKRNSQYMSAKKATGLLNTLGTFSGLWLMFYPEPYKLSVAVNIILPAIGIFIYIKFKEYVQFDEEKGREHSNVGWVVGVPSVVLAFRAIMDFNIIYRSALFIFIAVITIAIVILIILKTDEYKTKKWLPLLMSFFILGYVYGSFIIINCTFDYSKPVKYSTSIADKYISEGKSKTYYLTVLPWGPFSEKDDIQVSKGLYETVEKGEMINILLKDGLCGVKWFIPSTGN